MGPLILLLCVLQGVVGTHFAYGTMSWIVTGKSGDKTQIKLMQQYAWRRNYYFDAQAIKPTPSSCPEKNDPYIGACPIATIGTVGNYQIMRLSDNNKMIGSKIGTFLVMQESVDLLRLNVGSNANWIRGLFNSDWLVDSDTAEYIVYFTAGERLSSLQDGNNDKDWLISCNIKISDPASPFSRSRSPSTTGSIREYLEACQESLFAVLPVKSDGRQISTYSSNNSTNWTPSTLNGVRVGNSGPLKARLPLTTCDSKPLASVSTNGKLTWFPKAPTQSTCNGTSTNTATTCLGKRYCFWDDFRKKCETKDEYAVQFTLTESSPSILFTTYDVIFEVSKLCAKTDTSCNHAPHFSPRYAGPYVILPATLDATYHKGVCGDVTGTACPCLRGVEKILPIIAVDYDLNQTVTASYSLLPYGASISPPEIIGTLLRPWKDPYESGEFKAATKYTLKWIPSLDAIDAAICFQALDSEAKPSNGNYCLAFVILEADYIYVSGIVRDFLASHEDFGLTYYTADNGVQWVNDVLTNGKPTIKAGSTLQSVKKFDDWFNTKPGVNQQTVFSTTLVKLGAVDRFTYSNTNFLPINGLLLGNDDTQNYPGRGYNSFFTYEMHTYLAYNVSTNVNYTFGSSDDMWVFINGILVPNWSLHGIHPVKYHVIDLKKLLLQDGNPLKFDNDTTLYRVDLFYADRSLNRTEPMIQMELPQAVLCDALSSGLLEMSFDFNRTTTIALSGTDLFKIGAVVDGSQGLNLLTQSQTASAVYVADKAPTPMSRPLKVLQGFQATFDFVITKAPTPVQGFAFVISSQPAVGSAGNMLGYGGIQKVLAIEFDTNQDVAYGDPTYDHIAVMAPAMNSTTGFSSLSFTANHSQYALATSVYKITNPEFGPLLTMTNGSSHHVRITYAPPQQGDTSIYKTGWLRVWIGAVIKPVVEVPIPALFLANMLGSAAHVGFTCGAGNENPGRIFIQNLQIIIVPPSPTNTIVQGWTSRVVAGVTTTALIQSRDSCGNNILVGADQARFNASIRVRSSNRELTQAEAPFSFTTNNDGTYNFAYSSTKAGDYVVAITFVDPLSGIPTEIAESGKSLSVVPAATSKDMTTFAFGVLPVSNDNSEPLPSNGLYMIAVRATDGVLMSRVQSNDPSTILSWLNGFGAGIIIAVVNVGLFTGSSTGLNTKFNSLGCTNFPQLAASPAQAVSWGCISNTGGPAVQAVRRLEPIDELSKNFGAFLVVAQNDATASRAYLNVLQTADTTRTFFASTSDVTTTVSVIARDQYGNVNTEVQEQFTISFSPAMTAGPTTLTVQPSAPGYYSGTLSTTRASTYTMQIILQSENGGGNIADTPSALTFLAGSASHLTSTASGVGLSNSQAGLPSQFSIQLIDQFGNQIRDTMNAVKNSVVVYFVNVADPSVIVNCSQSWNQGASELQVSYTPLVLGTYNLVLQINGNAAVYVAGRQMVVVPGAVSAPQCTYSDVSEADARSGPSKPLSNVAAGVQACIWVQSRDQFGNSRNSPSDIFDFVVFGSVRNIESSYIGGGVYRRCFIPVVAPATVNVTIRVGGTLIGTPPLNYRLSVAIGAPSTLSSLPQTVLNVTAGVPKSLVVKCVDSENNTITNCNSSQLVYTLFTSNAIPSTLTAQAGPTPGTVTISAGANITGTYTVQVRVNSQQISYSPVTMIVTPAATDGSYFGRSTPPSGSGAFGGVQGENATFTIQCADQFGNAQNHHNDLVVAKINNGAAIPANKIVGVPGLWEVTYLTPSISTFNISYSINNTLTFDRPASGANNDQLCQLDWNTSAVYKVPAGTTLNLHIPYLYDNVVVTSNSTSFANNSAIIFQVALANVSLAPQIEFTTTVDSNKLYPYQGSFSGLQYVGRYVLTAFLNRVVPCTPSYYVEVVPGAIDPGATKFINVSTDFVAGQNYSFQVQLRDRFAQVIGNSSNVLALTLADVLGVTYSDFGSIYDSATSSYNFTFRVTQAGSYNAYVNLTSSQPKMTKLGQPPFIVIVPADPYVPKTVANPPSVQVAGSEVSFFVSLYDSVDNLCVNFDTARWDLNVTLGGRVPSALTITKSRADGRFLVTYIPTVAGDSVNITIALLDRNSSVGVVPLAPIRINAGDVSVPPSNVTQNTTPLVAGNPATLIFSAFDVNNNPVRRASLSAYVSGADGVKFPVPTDLDNGQYVITLGAADTQRVGSYNWTIQVNSQAVNITTAPLVIVPSAVDWSKLVIPSLTGSAVAAPVSAIVQLKDQFGNNVDTTPALNRIKVVMQQPGALCAALLRTDNESVVTLIDVTNSSFANVNISALSGGRLQIDFVPQTRGVFRMSLLLDDTAAPCQDSAIFSVSAGPVSGPASLLTITTNTTADASSVKTARISFLDAYGNNVDDFTCRFMNKIYFGNHSYGTNPVVQPSSNWIVPRWSINCQLEGQYFVYSITFQAPIAGEYLSVLTLLDDSGQFAVISGPRSLSVVPGVALTFEAPTDANGKVLNATSSLRATYAGQFNLFAKDSQSNPIKQTNTHYFEITCRLQNANGAVLYSFEPTITSQPNFHRAQFFSTWAGLFQCEAKLFRVPDIYVTVLSFPLKIEPAVCPRFQCLDGTCVTDYATCTPAPACSGAASVQCWDGSCKASSLDCDCPPATVRCQNQGYCVASQSLCPPLVGTCSAAVRCPTGECPTAAVPCPSLTVCPPGFRICSDALTCVVNATECPAPASCSGTRKYACAQGNCVASASDCPNRATCPSGTVLCFDGTCAPSSTQCPSIYQCPASTPFRCSDASCVPRQADCPSQTNCPAGFVLCWNDVCAATLQSCDPITTCPSGTLRCSTGDCAVNIYMCPSQSSCPTKAPVLCPDGACVTSVSQCSLSFACPAGFLTCPSGSCIQSANVACPTQTSCASATPVLCTDGSCVASAENCTQPPACPVASPVRCPDGSCRGTILSCPTMVVCPRERPVSCPDGYCAADKSQCVPSSQLTCPPPYVRCFYGECVAYLNACPPHTTCPLGYDRCSDGTCRESCETGVIALGQCPAGHVQCPQSSIGTSCATSLALCPPGVVCPVSTPVRCFDGSCALTLADCVQGGGTTIVPNYPKGTEIPCPDGTWSPDGLCGTPISCPLGQFLCSNYQCLTVQTDCPVSATCAASSGGTGSLKPLLCGTVCVADFSSNDCVRATPACSSSQPYRCADGECRESPNLCVNSGAVSDSRCGTGLSLCRDGTCSGACPSAAAICAKISPSTPYACPDGMCADVAAHCNKDNGCPYDFPLRCPNSGVCTKLLSSCDAIVCPANTWQSFGFCVSDAFNGQIRYNRCPVSLPQACFDGTCVTASDACTSSTWDTPPDVAPPNACPLTHSYRCANGFCAVASNMCPTIPTDYCEGSLAGKTACASGACVTSSIFCPVVRPCLISEKRGADGVCRSIVDFIQPYGDLVVSSCRATYPFRCPNGLCAKDASSCLNPTTMCSAQEPTRCPGGACIAGDVELCDKAEPTGCNSSTPVKCWNGDCMADESLCPTTDMCPGQPTYSRCPKSRKCVADILTGCDNDELIVQCPASSPVRCDSCESSVTQCLTTEGCPLDAPVRCASGLCSKAGQCPPTVVCDLGQVVCADGSCQFDLVACPPFPACAPGTMLCSDKTCKANCAGSACPATSPILCRNGACTSNLKLCPGVVSIELNPGVPNGQDTFAPECPETTAPMKCFDGRCRTYEECAAFARQVNASGAGLLSCTEPSTICSDGTCVEDLGAPVRAGIYCPIIPRCPPNTYRCGDGSCRKTYMPATGSCPAGKLRCEDGLCRSACLAYDGCGLHAPFHCSNRNCAWGPDGCFGQSSSQGVAPITSASRRLLQSNTTTEAPTPITWCQSNCISQMKAYQMTVTVDPSASPQVDLAVDSSNRVVASVLIPSGSLLSKTDDEVTIEFRPVADSLLRTAENAVHPTRQGEFGSTLAYSETLLSVAFECAVPTSVGSPFALNLTYSATIDYTRKPITQFLAKQNVGPDVCLAYLYRIPALRYARWTCFPDGVIPRHALPPNTMPAGVELNRVSGPISDCGSGPVGKIYGFIHSPLKSTNVEVESKEKTWAERNVLLVMVIFLVAAIVLGLCIYCGFRLRRYHKKYLQEAAKVDQLKEEVAEMEQYGGTAGTKDEEVEMIPNVMVVQLQQVQEALDSHNKEEKEKELEQLRLESEERRKHLETLRADRDNLAQELAQLQADLNKQQNAPVARPVIEDFTPQDTAHAAASSSPVDASPALRAPMPSTKTAFQSVRPTKKKDL